MDDQRVIIETDKSLVLNNCDQEAIENSCSLAMAVDQAVVHESVVVVRSDRGITTEGSIDHNKKAKGVLEGNAAEEKELKDERVSSCVIAVKLDDDEDDGNGGGGQMVCRICHLSSDQSPERFGVTSGRGKMRESSLVQLGCGCKDELGVAHSHCAGTWFKLKGNRTCEICGEAAKNVTGILQEPTLVEWNNRRSYTSGGSYSPERSGGCWCGRPCCNFLMVCLIVAFVLPWFLRVKIV